MTAAGLFRHCPTCLGKENATIGFAGNKPFARKTRQHFCNSRLRYTEALGQINLTGFLPFVEQVSDQFHIIFNQSILSCDPVGAKPF